MMTRDDLPASVVKLEHPEEEAEAERLGKIPMGHYGTPEDAKRGGPVYGVHGYEVVSIEHEIPISALGSRLVGSTDLGQLLALPEISTLRKSISYDHFHIGISAHAHEPSSHEHDDAESREHDDAGFLIIHFMLIPHEREEALGLYCG